jgi:hypothetical protein
MSPDSLLRFQTKVGGGVSQWPSLLVDRQLNAALGYKVA